ncbi:hypothetical protein [Acidianus ambivalens]|uniref:Uncharacterized protein n=1 Tax=Acidianus ambivalens TaxID=2283 RepID=A0A6G1T729_ACIAM|nr:hypothetical protein [Acidianus ambivalens]MQL56626.1 hypothetical protein [Acidianus ambivalens]
MAEELRKELNLDNKDKLDLGDYVTIMGKILSFKAKSSAYTHSVTKEVREALEEVRKNPTGNVEEIIKILISQDSPFQKKELADLYREALEGLLKKFAEVSSRMNPQESRKLMNMILEGIYNNAVFYSKDFGQKIWSILKGDHS